MPEHARNVVAGMLAGGQGERLCELTETICKPAVPFARGRRIVDWTMDNLVRMQAARVLVATQYRPDALVDHLNARWRGGLARGVLAIRDGVSVTGQARGYVGTADAVTRNLAEIATEAPDVVLVVAADHVCRMNYDRMIAAHRASGRPVSVAVDRVSVDQARAFGVIDMDAGGGVTAFTEKPRDPPGMADDPNRALVSMGVYVFDWEWLRNTLVADRGNEVSSHDFGHDILPGAVRAGEVQAFDAAAAHERFYWRDVDTLDALRRVCIELEAIAPPCATPPYPGRPHIVQSTLILPEGSVALPGAMVSRGARLRNAIIAPGAIVPGDLEVGYDPEVDARHFRVTPGGTVLVTPMMLARRSAGRMRAMLGPRAVVLSSARVAQQ